ncbi:LysE family translocator [Luteibacter yeojuensis]|uniref:LysE family translocator n=1 Tax=Luteibacter yeojuensis TaxID=345309 RepID=A0A7X5QSH4_9GAMM|nr:LysE family translocator [Luteibacter yeojuensis]NID14591.1 LysE family translocator [Luteibacter yeojuensis]
MPISDMPGIDHFGAFLMGCAVLNLTPGLDTFYILARSSREGRVVGIAAALGINAGCLVHTVAAVLGVSTILATSAAAFAALKYIGAAYLCWLGIRMLLKRPVAETATVTEGRGFMPAFMQGLFTNALNPKVALFYLAFLPPFVSLHAANVPFALLVLGLSFIATGLCWSMVLALVGARFRNLLEGRPATQTWMDRACGAVLVGFGSLLAIQQRR